MPKCDEINFVRFFLIVAVILVHIVNFGNAHPEVKSVIMSFLMPTFLFITGYLVNIDKTPKEFSVYLLRIFLPYTIMVIAFSVTSYYLPVQDRLTEMSAMAILEKVFVTSIGPYWFLQTMIICGLVYYACYHIPHRHLDAQSTLFVFCTLLIVVADRTEVLSVKASAYYFLGASLRQAGIQFNFFFTKSSWAILPIAIILSHDEMRDWGSIGILTVVYCAISLLSWSESIVRKWRFYHYILFIGANTLPIYLFHPVFTMLAKFYLPLFTFDPTGITHAVCTVIIAISGSILIAKVMDRTRLSYLFGRRSILRNS